MQGKWDDQFQMLSNTPDQCVCVRISIPPVICLCGLTCSWCLMHGKYGDQILIAGQLGEQCFSDGARGILEPANVGFVPTEEVQAGRRGAKAGLQNNQNTDGAAVDPRAGRATTPAADRLGNQTGALPPLVPALAPLRHALCTVLWRIAHHACQPGSVLCL